MSSKSLFINRELSWIQFNERVLAEAKNQDNPPLERAKFLSIVSSNLDEFFMVRVGKLERKMDAGQVPLDPAGLSPKTQLSRIRKAVSIQVREQYEVYQRQLLPSLREHGLFFFNDEDLNQEQKSWLSQYFDTQVMPVLTPRAITPQRSFPILLAKAIYIAVLLQSDKGGRPVLNLIPVPRTLPRVVMLPMGRGQARGILLEDVIRMFLDRLFLYMTPLSSLPFRITRNTDFVMDLENLSNLLEEMSKNVKRRSYGKIVRLEVQADADKHLLEILQNHLQVDKPRVFKLEGPLDLRFLMRETAGLPGFDALRYPPYTPRINDRLKAHESIFRTIRGGDLFFHHPYDSFDPIVRFLSEAANDPNVQAIKQTLYRVSNKSPLIAALARAAQNGKEVTVLIEVRARFDEEHNIAWCKSLEKAGCHVLYGVPKWKTHSKICLVIRREADGLKHYTHISTGNYNDVTAKIYTDMSFLTCDKQIGEDASAFFNLITGYASVKPLRQLIASPYTLRSEILSRIKREEENAQNGLPSGITMKMNSLSDPEIIIALESAAQNGVKVRLMVRGICCLNYKENEFLKIYSTVGRFLEHPRIYVFKNAGKTELFISSADMMPRNLDKRVELTAPVKDPHIKQQIIDILELGFLDNRKAWQMMDGGKYERVPAKEPAINAQEALILYPNPLKEDPSIIQILKGGA